MIIGIDGREIENGVSTGIGRALSVFLEYFAAQDDGNRCVIFSGVPLPVSYGTRVENIVVRQCVTFLWDQWTLPRLMKKHAVDVFFSPYYKIPLWTRCPCVSTIFDLMYIYCDCYRTKWSFLSRLYYQSIGALMARKARAILTCSNYSKSEILDFYRVDQSKVHVIYLGLASIYKPVTDETRVSKLKDRLGIHSDFILYVGNFKPHKNIPALLAAFDNVHRKKPGIHLVLSGPEDSRCARLKKLADRSAAKPAIVFTGRLSEEDQAALYSCARALVMPSLYEGFGYPPLEAMACGTPVISSDTTSLKEIVGDAGILVEPRNSGEMASAILDILESPDTASRLRKKGFEQSRRFGQRKYFNDVYRILMQTG